MSWKARLGTAYIKYKIRVGRGSTFTSEIDGLVGAFQKGGVIVLLISAYFHVLVPLYVLPVLWLIQKGLEYVLGWYDEKHLKWWAFETKYQQNNPDINPFQYDLLRRVKRIERIVKHMEKKEPHEPILS